MSTNQVTLGLEPADEQSLERSRELRDELHGRLEEDNDNEDGFDTDGVEPDVDEPEPMEVGGEFRVDLHYSATYTTTVVAADESHAKELASMEVDYGSFQSADHVHTDTRKQETIYEDDERAEEHDLTW